MFKYLKGKLKDTISKISENIKSEGEDESVEVEELVEEDISKIESKEKIEEKPEEDKEPEEVEETEEETKPEPQPDIEPKTDEEEEPVIEPIAEETAEPEEEVPEKKSFFSKIARFGRKEDKEKTEESEQEEQKEEVSDKDIKEEKPEEEEKKQYEEKIEEDNNKGIFSKIKNVVATKKINDKKFEEMFWDLELALLENNVAVEVIEKIKKDLKISLVDKPLARGMIEKQITNTLKSSLNDILETEQFSIIDRIKENKKKEPGEKKPYIICFVGINGSGKTTTIAKIAHMLKEQGISCCLAAADTFRAAAIDQLAYHAEKIGVKIIKHEYGSDPAAVAFDAIKHAKAKNLDAVLIDTAGRIHSNVNLQDEMKKIIRVANPDLKIFVGESITGNDCIEQASKFNESINIDAIILSKADIDEKGGAAISISYVTQKPIIYLGTGQEYQDIEIFDKEKILSSIGL